MSVKDLKGKRFVNLKVLSDTGKRKHKHAVWLCKCDCGNEKEITGISLTSGRTKSCGCLRMSVSWASGNRSNNYKHGMKNTPIYAVWHHIKSRCGNPKDKSYKNYGGRGITYCKKWENFEGFYEDMGEGFEEGLSIDRIDVNGNYVKENCRWATPKQQSHNRRNNRLETVDGVIDTLTNHCEKFNIGYSSVITRIKSGWDLDTALKTPIRKHKKYKKTLS